MPALLQDWVMELPPKLQSAVLSAIRGCDGVPREDIMKVASRGVRKMTLLPATDKSTQPGGYMYFELRELRPAIDKICEDIAKYPVHFVHHLYLAFEVIGYYHPVTAIREEFYYAYCAMVKELNLYPESKEQCTERSLKGGYTNRVVSQNK